MLDGEEPFHTIRNEGKASAMYFRREPEPGWTKRRKVARIVGKLRDRNGLAGVAAFLGVNSSYVIFAEGMTRRGNSYHCPAWVIRHILTMDLMKADITGMAV